MLIRVPDLRLLVKANTTPDNVIEWAKTLWEMPNLEYRTANEALKECQEHRDNANFAKDFGKLGKFLEEVDKLNADEGEQS